MSAAEVIEQIEKLPREEQAKVAEYMQKLEAGVKTGPQVAGVSEEFKRIADEVFTTNAELFRKLAQ